MPRRRDIVLAGLLGFLVALLIPLVHASGSAPYVTVSGTGLTLNGDPFIVHGVTNYGWYNGTDPTHGTKPQYVADTMPQLNLNVAEAVNFDTAGGHGNYSATDPSHQALLHEMDDTAANPLWTNMDKWISTLETAHIHIAFILSEHGVALKNAPSGSTCPNNTSATSTGCDYLDPSNWTTYLNFIATRVNSQTGLTYASDPGIFKISLWGEIPPPGTGPPPTDQPWNTTANMTAFFASTLSMMHNVQTGTGLFPNQIVSTGGFSHLNDPNSGIDWQTIMTDPSNQICEIEIYSHKDRNITVPLVTPFCQSKGKPWFVAAWSSCYGAGNDESNFDGSKNTPPVTRTYLQADPFMAGHATDMEQIAFGTTPATYPAIGNEYWNIGDTTASTCQLGLDRVTNQPNFPLTVQAIKDAGTPPPGPVFSGCRPGSVALTTQSQVAPNTAFCGGTATTQIQLADGDSWYGGEVTGGGITTTAGHGALECLGSCVLTSVNVHGVPHASAAFYAPGATLGRVVVIEGGTYAGAADEGIGLAGASAYVAGAYVYGNGTSSTSCSAESGGIEWQGFATVVSDSVHDNYCAGVTASTGARGKLNNVTSYNNNGVGLFVDISHDIRVMASRFTGDTVGIQLNTSYNIEIDHDTLSGDANTLLAYEDNRSLNIPTYWPGLWDTGAAAHPPLLRQLHGHDNAVDFFAPAPAFPQLGLIALNGDGGVFDSSSNHFMADAYTGGCTAGNNRFIWNGANIMFAQWQAAGQDVVGSSCS